MSESEQNTGHNASSDPNSQAEQQTTVPADEAMELVVVQVDGVRNTIADAQNGPTTSDAVVQLALAEVVQVAQAGSLSTSSLGHGVTTTTTAHWQSSVSTNVTTPANHASVQPTVTVGEIEQIVACLKNNTAAPERLMHLVNRLVPFAKSLPGTPLAFKNAKKELHSIVASPLYDKKPWRWFITFSNADLFEEYIFRMICSDGNGNVKTLAGVTLAGEEAEAYLRSLTLAERTAQLRMHPALATRSYMIKQQLIMKYIVEAQETFGKVVDHWIRVEFQRSLNAHLHIILSVHDDSNFERLALVGQRLSDDLASLLKTTCTAEVSYVLVVLK